MGRLGTLACGLAGSVVAPVVYAMLPPYRAMGARIAFAVWTPIVFAAVVTSGLAMFVAQLFPWPILAAMVAYVSIGVGAATLRRVDAKYMSVVLLAFVLPAGAVVAAAMNSALPALQLSATNPAVAAALNRSMYWSSVQGLGNGFLFLVLIVASTTVEIMDRRFGRASAMVSGCRDLFLGRDAFGDASMGRRAGACGRLARCGGHRLFGAVVARRRSFRQSVNRPACLLSLSLK